jgi:DNA-binding transcriptional regulator LsrR (DeoR family)
MKDGDWMSSTEVSEHIKTRVAWLYFVEGMTQDEIASQTGLNRSRVLRILATARRDGTVQIRVTAKLSHCVDLERALEERWGLSQAIVIPEPRDPSQISSILGVELGAYLSRNVTSRSTIGLGWGKTLTSALPAVAPQQPDDVRVLSLLGGLTRVSAVNPPEFAWRVADRLNAECHLLTAPVFAPDRRSREALVNHPGIAEIFARAKSLDMAIVSVGALTPHSAFYEYGLLTREEISSLEAAGAVGDVLCHFVDEEGHLVRHPVNERVVAVNPIELRETRNAVLVSGGWHKLKAIRAGLKLLRPNVLIVNELVGEQLLARETSEPRKQGAPQLAHQ